MSAIEMRPLRAVLSCFIACACVLLATSARGGELSDAEAKRFFNDYGCNSCHAVDELRIGPPFRGVAIRYAATDETIATLGQKIRFGGAGAWGLVPMISYPGLTDEQIQAITRWILNLKRDAAPAKGAGG
jgi:cytochrome c